MSKTKIVFFGTPEFSLPAFRFLVENNYQIIGAVTAPDKSFGRKKILTPSPVKTFAQQNNIPVFQPNSLKKEPDFLQQFKELAPDLCIIVAYGKIIPKDYLVIPKYGFVNIHPSLLPKYRGPSPIQSAILNGEKETGVTIMLADEETDHGSVLEQIKHEISNTKSFKEISQKLSEVGAKLLIDTLPSYLDGTIQPKPQNHSEATFTKMLKREDGKINWNQSAEQIYNQVRALNPEPGTWTLWNNQTLNIAEGEISPASVNLFPGQVQIIDNQIAVATSAGYLILKSLQLEGGKKIDAKSFLNGHPDFADTQLH